MSRSRPRILIVDDDVSFLEACVRDHGLAHDLVTADGPSRALEEIEKSPGFAVVLSDLHMPGMDGITFLRRVQEIEPDAVRLIMSASADLDAVVAAVNEGCVFRFLTKPCDARTIDRALEASLRQHEIVTAVDVLLEETVMGSVRVLTDLLVVINPTAFGRSSRAWSMLQQVIDQVPDVRRWELEMACMLSQVGCASIPAATLERAWAGQPLQPQEERMLENHPRVGSALVRSLPRFSEVAAIISLQGHPYDGRGAPALPSGEDIPVEARLLRIALDIDQLNTQGWSIKRASRALHMRRGLYDPRLIKLFFPIETVQPQRRVRVVDVDEMHIGMVLDENLLNMSERVILPKETELTADLLYRLRNYASREALIEPVRVLVTLGAIPVEA